MNIQNKITQKLEYIFTLIFTLFTLLMLFSPAVKAADLNSKHDLCTGANLSVDATGAGCGKVYDPASGK